MNAFNKYHNYKPFLNLIEKKFGKKAADNIIEMTKIKLKRKIKGDQNPVFNDIKIITQNNFKDKRGLLWTTWKDRFF